MTGCGPASRSCVLAFAALALAAGAVPRVARAQLTRRGSEIQVNRYTTSQQRAPTLAMETNGDFVIAWDSYNQDGSYFGVFSRRFSSGGTALASELQVNTTTSGSQEAPGVAVDGDGDFVVVWQAFTLSTHFDLFAHRFSSTGTALASQFQVNTRTLAFQGTSSVATDGDGDFVVAWQSNYHDGNLNGVFARRFTSDGTALATEFQVNTRTASNQAFPSVAVAAGGDFVIAWHGNFQDGDDFGVFAQRFTSDGAALASEFQVNAHTTSLQLYPAVGADADGDFVVVWESGGGQDGDGFGIFAQRFSSAGAALGAEFQVNARTTSAQTFPAVAMKSGGDFVVAWQSSQQDGSDYGIFARSFSSAGAPLATELQINTFASNAQARGAVAAVGSLATFAWQSTAQDGDNLGVFAQRYGAAAILDVDGNGSTDPLTDGLLVLRYEFGFRGSVLVAGAVDAVACTRCDATAIEAYLAGLV